MERKFPVIICELRKEKGLSQKEAAQKLDISQALLSHYEKGIRECGQSFLMRLADFYGVTCDYLLGRTKSRDGRETPFMSLEPESDDAKPSPKTFLKASALIQNTLKPLDFQINSTFESILFLQLYKILILEAKAGNLPKSWIGRAFSDGELYSNELFIHMIDNASTAAIKPSKSKRNSVDENEEVPEVIKTLVRTAEKSIFEEMIQKLPPIPPEYLK